MQRTCRSLQHNTQVTEYPSAQCNTRTTTGSDVNTGETTVRQHSLKRCYRVQRLGLLGLHASECSTYNVPVSQHPNCTIGRRLHHPALHAHRPLPRLSLTPRHRHQRLQWCRTRLSWSDSEWQRVIFSDESRFSLGGDTQRIRVWRHRGQHRDGRSVTRPEGLVSLHLHPYRTICRNCVRKFKLHGMEYHRTPLGASTAPYRDVWRVGEWGETEVHGQDDMELDQEKLIFSITLPLSSAIILANLIIIVGIACNRQLHNTPNYFFLSLLVADLCTGIALPFIPRMGLNRALNFQACLLMHIFPNFLFLSFLFNLVMVHYERYLCIVSPLHYSQFWVHRCFPAALLAVWMPPLLYASLPAFGWNNWNDWSSESYQSSNVTGEGSPGGNGSGNCSIGACPVDQSCSYKQVFPKAFIYLEVYGLLLPAILCIVGMTGRVLWIARKQLRDICKLHRAVERQEASDHEQQLNLRYAKCVAAVSLTFLLCWVPYIVYLHVSVALFQGDSKESSSLNTILSCTGIGSMAIIPVILGLANRQYTEPVRKLLRKLRDRWTSVRNSGDATP
ncbi:hypothetical protein NFI96_007927 [Prochilodus magdalenae]|nr:hypothetical protein NFI96_007927 [Prochilodus magdalenae]